eukprot:1366044-Prymnesium_polylepis.1
MHKQLVGMADAAAAHATARAAVSKTGGRTLAYRVKSSTRTGGLGRRFRASVDTCMEWCAIR